MKKEPSFTFLEIILIAAVLLLVMIPYTHAADSDAMSPGQCKSLGAIASSTVRSRVQGIPMLDLVDMVGKNVDQAAQGLNEAQRAELDQHYDHIIQIVAWVYKLPKVQNNANEETIKGPDGEIVGYRTVYPDGDKGEVLEGSPEWVERFFDVACRAGKGRLPMIGRRM